MMNSVQLVCILAMFLCTSKDVLGAYLDFSVSIPSQMQEPKLGDTVIIYCNADSPQTILGWTADGINIVDLTSLAFNTDGNSLTIDSFDKSYDAIYQCIANEIDAATGQLSPPILVSSFENRYFVQQPEIFTAYIVQLAGGMGYEPITFQCELVKIFNGTKPIITWQYIDTEGGDVLNYTDFENAVNNRYIVQYDHIGYFQVHSPTAALNGSRARCVATRPDSPTEVVYSEWASANLIDMVLPDGFDIQPGFEPFSQVPPTVYHVEEGQTSANLPCSSVTGLHSHLLQWEYETEDNIIFISGFILIPSLVGQVSLYADTILTVDVSNDKFVDRTFLCIIRTSDNVPKRATSLIAGPAPPLDPPTVFNSSFDVVTSINSNTTLTYEIQTNDTVVSVWWWKDEVLIPFDADTQSLNGMTATLTIRNTKALDSGLYQVLALTGSRYAFTGETGIFDVTVESAAFITSSTGDIIADNGATVTLEVTAEGTPNNITYEWSKDGVVIPNEVSNTLTIDPISVNDIGEYECIPSNAAGSFNSSIIQVDVKVPDISFDVLTDTAINQPIGPSSVAGYTCTPVIPNGEINTSGDLVINGQLNVADEGTYKCTSAEINGDIVIELVATASAFITSSTGDIIADNGATVTLEVTAEGTPNDITYEWRKDGVVIPNEVSNTLTIDPISVNDIGEYECIPSNAAGSFNSSIIQVDVKVPDISFDVLTDTAINQPIGPSSVAGYNCTPLIPNGEINTSGDLVINGQLNVADEGTYKCTSAEINGDIVIELVATASAFITSSTGDIIADNGATVTLEVTAEGTPNNITYEWRKDDVVIPNEVSNTLTIDPISVNDIGEYECIPSNAVGSFNSSIIQVDVKVPDISFDVLTDTAINQPIGPSSVAGYNCTPLIPNGEINTSGDLVINGRLDIADEGTYKCTSAEIDGDIVIELVATASAFITSSTGDIIADNGATVTLEVTAEGTPNDITYEWRKDGVVIPNEVSNTLIIDQISVNDIGEYECIPSNAAGSFNSSIIQVDVEVPIQVDGLSDSSTIVAPPTASGYSCIPANPRVQLLPNGTLRTYDLGVTDTGVYMCVANNPDEVRGTITFNISVFLPAYVAIGVRAVRKRVGEMMALSCNAKGDVLSYVWKKDGIVIPDANQSFYIIYDILKSDIGHYECIPSNAFGTHNTTEVIVNIETELSLDWLTRYEVQLLPSASNGYRCTPPLNRASISNTGLFTTNGLQLIDGNRYRCTSTSFNGTFILVLRITGHTPEAPNLLEPRITEDGLAINITWNIIPSSIKPVTQYILFWRLETEDRDDERDRRQSDDEQSIVTRDTSYNLTDYDREAVYTFWVVAENGAGRSPLSNSEEFDVEVEFNLQFQSSEREKEMRLAGWLIALIVILCLLCCCICCLCWLILCCCLLRKKKVYHAEEEEKKHSGEMEKYRKKGEDEDDEDDEDEDTAGEEEGEITGDNNGDTPGEGDNNGDTPGEGDNNGDTPGEGDNNGSTAGGEGDAGDTAGGGEGPDPTGDDTADGTTIEPV